MYYTDAILFEKFERILKVNFIHPTYLPWHIYTKLMDNAKEYVSHINVI